MKHNYQIGDWVYDSKRSQYPMQVVAVFGERNGTICDLDLDFEGNEGGVWECKADEVVPIPITDEFLKTNGFEKIAMYHYLYLSNRDYLQYYPHECILRKYYKGELLFQCHCRYVHRLQQALRLCGIDKEIQL